MKRASRLLTVLFLLTVPTISLLDRAAHRTQAAGVEELRPVAHRSRGPSLTIVFRGLMVFHPDAARQYFEVGILRAPEHEFRMQVLEKSPEGVSSFSVPLEQFLTAKSDVWSLEFPSSTKGVSFYKGGSFDRRSGTGDKRDFRWLIDLESSELYGRKLSIDNNQLAIMLRVNGGEFYTKTTTFPLTRRKGDGTFEYFGRVAQEIATDVFLEEGDMVLRSETSREEIFRLKETPDTTYEIVIENLPLQHHYMPTNFNHFQYYYRVFPMPRTEWYEFEVASREKPSGLNFLKAGFSVPGTDRAPCMGAGYGQGSGP
jgi:hypothetical protein